MTFNVPFFLAAVALLWLPLPFFSRKDQAYGTRGRVVAATVPGLFKAWQNWTDLFRSAAGTFMLLGFAVGVDPESGQAGQAEILKHGILLVGVLLQTFRFNSGQTFLAPLFYLTGLTVILPGYTVGGFAVVVAWAFAGGMKDPRFLLPVMVVALGVAGYFLSGLSRVVLLDLGLLVTPLFLALLFQKRLVFISRECTRYGRGKDILASKSSKQTPSKIALKSRPSAAK